MFFFLTCRWRCLFFVGFVALQRNAGYIASNIIVNGKLNDKGQGQENMCFPRICGLLMTLYVVCMFVCAFPYIIYESTPKLLIKSFSNVWAGVHVFMILSAKVAKLTHILTLKQNNQNAKRRERKPRKTNKMAKQPTNPRVLHEQMSWLPGCSTPLENLDYFYVGEN